MPEELSPWYFTGEGARGEYLVIGLRLIETISVITKIEYVRLHLGSDTGKGVM